MPSIKGITDRFFKTKKFSKLLKILILGSEGFVGHNLVEGLSKNHQIFCADLIPNSNHKNYKQFDITDLSSVDQVVRDVDVVVDLVAHSLQRTVRQSQLSAARQPV